MVVALQTVLLDTKYLIKRHIVSCYFGTYFHLFLALDNNVAMKNTMNNKFSFLNG